MPWQTKGHVREIITNAVSEAKHETLERMRHIELKLDKVNVKVDNLEDSLATVKGAIAELRLHSEHQADKISTLIEGAVRDVLSDYKGRKFTLACKVSSLNDALEYIRDMMGEDGHWLERARSHVVDELLSEDLALRAGRLMESFIRESQEMSWAQLRTTVEENPFIDDQEQLSYRGFARAVNPTPRFYKSLLIEFMTIAKAFDREFFWCSSLSLATCHLAADSTYENAGYFPPFSLEWGCQGSIEEHQNGTIYLGGAEIKSSKRGFNDGFNQLLHRFRLLVFLLRVAYPSWQGRQFVAEGSVLSPWIGAGKPMTDTTMARIDPLATVHITCQEIENFQ